MNAVDQPVVLSVVVLEDLRLLEDPRFVGLWNHGHGQVCASVIVDGVVQETSLRASWKDAIHEAARMLHAEQSQI